MSTGDKTRSPISQLTQLCEYGKGNAELLQG